MSKILDFISGYNYFLDQLSEFIDINSLLSTCHSLVQYRFEYFMYRLNQRYSLQFTHDLEYRSEVISLCKCTYRQISLNLSNTEITSIEEISNVSLNTIDLSDCTYLTNIEFPKARIKFLNLSNCINIIKVTGNPSLVDTLCVSGISGILHDYFYRYLIYGDANYFSIKSFMTSMDFQEII